MKHWTQMTIRQMVAEFRDSFSVAELREERDASENALADYDRMIALHRRRIAAIDLLLQEHAADKGER